MSSVRDSVHRFFARFRRDARRGRLREMRGVRVVLPAVVRLGVVVRCSYARHRLSMRAQALTYITLFSLVPTIAVGFAMFKAFGGLENAESVLLPKLMDYLAVGVREQVQARIHQMLGNIHGGAIGATGLLFLVFAAVSLLGSIEDALNDIWGVAPKRTYFQRLTTYWTVVSLTPALLLVGISVPAVIMRWVPVRPLLAHAPMPFLLSLVPVLFVSAGFGVTYWFLTEARVTVAAAAIGGITGGVLWSLAAWAYSWYVRTTVYYASIYGSLSAIPIFVFWIYVSWFIVLLGALVAFAWQHIDTYRQETLAPEASEAARERLALRIVVEVARRFLRGEPPARSEELSALLGVSARLVNELIDQLTAAGWLVVTGDTHAVAPGRDPTRTSPMALLADLRTRGDPVRVPSDPTMCRLEELQHREAEADARIWGTTTLAALADVADDERPARRRNVSG